MAVTVIVIVTVVVIVIVIVRRERACGGRLSDTDPATINEPRNIDAGFARFRATFSPKRERTDAKRNRFSRSREMSRLAQFLNESLWAVTEERFSAMQAAIESIERGTVLREPETRAPEHPPFLMYERGGRVAGPVPPADRAGQKAVLVLPFCGTIYPKMSMAISMSGGVNLSATMAVLRRAVNDPGIGSVIADFDSPGGMVAGVPEAAAEIRSLRGRKPMSAVANFQMASAAYFLGSQFDEVVASPSSSLGSIGVVAQYLSEGRRLASEGYEVQTLKHPDKKAEADGVTPLSSEAVAYRMESIRRVYDDFVGAIVCGLRVPRAKIEAEFGNGRSLDADQAVNVGMAHRIGTFESLLSEHMSGRVRRMGAFQNHVSLTEQRAVELPKPLRTVEDLRKRWGLATN